MAVTFEIRHDGCVGNATLAAFQAAPPNGEEVWVEFGRMSTIRLRETIESPDRQFNLTASDSIRETVKVEAGGVELIGDIVTIVAPTNNGMTTMTLDHPCFSGYTDIDGLFKASRVSETSDIWRIDAVP